MLQCIHGQDSKAHRWFKAACHACCVVTILTACLWIAECRERTAASSVCVMTLSVSVFHTHTQSQAGFVVLHETLGMVMSTDHHSEAAACFSPSALPMSTSWMLSHLFSPALNTSFWVLGRALFDLS